MDLTSEEVERYLNRIFTGQTLFSLEARLLVFTQPDNRTQAKADLIYDKSKKKAIDTGMLPIAELEVLIEKRGLFTAEDRNKLEEFKSQKFAQEVILGKTTKVAAKQDRLKGIIDKLDEKIDKLERKRTSKLVMSAESKADEERALYLCWSCVTDDEGNKIWSTFEDMLDETDINKRDSILLSFLKFRSGLETKIVRYLARHSLWRIRYVTSQKVSDPLFGVPTSQYTNDMLNLAYWSNFYQNVYEMMPKDRPPDNIVEDDDALDAYMKEYYEERTREDATERDKNKLGTKGKLSAFNKEEVIVTKSHELYEDIDYTKPREAQMIKDKAAIRKTARKKRKR
jgi:hypothetical protein